MVTMYELQVEKLGEQFAFIGTAIHTKLLMHEPFSHS
jgi:hypothetical protein